MYYSLHCVKLYKFKAKYSNADLTSPSYVPENILLRLLGCLAIADIDSLCGNAATKGLANVRSSFVALRASLYSLAVCKGCRSGL